MAHGHHRGLVEIAGLAVKVAHTALVNIRVGFGVGVGAGVVATVLVIKERKPVEQAVFVFDLEEEVEPAPANDTKNVSVWFARVNGHGDKRVCPSALWLALIELNRRAHKLFSMFLWSLFSNDN